ncbi:trehalose-phosphatase [Chloroflexota bacterium]
MSYVFDHLDLIKKALRQSPFGFITDVDGTISKTAPTPQQAKVTPLCRQYLSVLCNQLALVAAISGRSAANIKSMLKINGMVYIGNHGLERWSKGHSEFTKDAQDYPKRIEAAIKELTPLLSMNGIIIENKGVTASIHYRLSHDPQSAEQHILAMIANSPHAKGLRTIQDRMTIDLVPPVKMNKGTATLELIQEYNLRGGIYLGDDLTDIDAFRAIHAAYHNLDFNGFAIGITSQETPEILAEETDFTLNGLEDVERLLKWLSQTVAELN